MLATFTAYLEARDPEHNHWRAYRLEAGQDLLGDWVVDVSYGRIGSRGRTIRHVAHSEDDARRTIFDCLKRRASAPKRIGVPYQLVECVRPEDWPTF